MDQNCQKNCEKQAARLKVINDEVKYQMRGSMFVTNQMRITLPSCHHPNIF